MNTESEFPMWSDDWWIEDAQKRYAKILHRMNMYSMSQKSFRAHIRMARHASKILSNMLWMKEYHEGGGK